MKKAAKNTIFGTHECLCAPMGADNLLGLIEELLQKLIQILIALDLAYSVPNHNGAPQTTPCHLKMTKSKKNQYTG